MSGNKPFLYGVLWTLVEALLVGLLLAVGVNRVVACMGRAAPGVGSLWCLFAGAVWYLPPRRGR